MVHGRERRLARPGRGTGTAARDAPYRGAAGARRCGRRSPGRTATRPSRRVRAASPRLCPRPRQRPSTADCCTRHARGSAPHERRSGYYGGSCKTTEERRDRCTISTIIRVVFDCGSSYRSVAWRRYSDRRLPGSGLPSGRSDAFGARARRRSYFFACGFCAPCVTIGGKDCKSHWLR